MEESAFNSTFNKKAFLILLTLQFCIILFLQLPIGTYINGGKPHKPPNIAAAGKQKLKEAKLLVKESGRPKNQDDQEVVENPAAGKQKLEEANLLVKESGRPKNQDGQDIVENQFMKKIDENPIYSRFKIPTKESRIKTNLLIIVSSAPTRLERRSAIRETWWTQCKSSEKVTVKCIFITDSMEDKPEVRKKLLAEQEAHKDLEFQKLGGGVEFGRRFLYHMVWAMKNYDFDYFMRMDDDYFFCLSRFLHEFPTPVRKMYHWGYVHCLNGIVRPEESIVLFSRDLIEIFLNQDPNVMKGHPWADQMVATWVQELKLDKLYNHDPRLHHHPPVRDFGDIPNRFKNVCVNYIGVHGSYPKYMRLLWTLRGGQEIVDGTLDKYAHKCNVPQQFSWMNFGGVWRYETKKLIDNPTWDTSKQTGNKKEYRGREEGFGR